ncbi:unnamed protein product [Closterium sp. NIES-65]|nr:unnamed protein product [Closterium sp. NIES-65]
MMGSGVVAKCFPSSCQVLPLPIHCAPPAHTSFPFCPSLLLFHPAPPPRCFPLHTSRLPPPRLWFLPLRCLRSIPPHSLHPLPTSLSWPPLGQPLAFAAPLLALGTPLAPLPPAHTLPLLPVSLLHARDRVRPSTEQWPCARGGSFSVQAPLFLASCTLDISPFCPSLLFSAPLLPTLHAGLSPPYLLFAFSAPLFSTPSLFLDPSPLMAFPSLPSPLPLPAALLPPSVPNFSPQPP